MLSTEITQIKDEGHLKAFLDRIHAPHSIPKGSPEERTFKQKVLDRLEEQRALYGHEYSDKSVRSGPITGASSSSRCCPCPRSSCRKSGSGADPEIVWRRLECKNLETFDTFALAAVDSNANIIKCLMAVNQSLSFWEESGSRPDWEGLSVLGAYGWILSFALQHLMDEDNPKDPTLLKGLEKIKELYAEMAQSSELFVDMVETFYEHSVRLRSDALYTVKKLVKKWKLEKHNPLQKHPDKPLGTPSREPIRRLGAGGLMDSGDPGDPSAFHLNWTPLMVMLKSKKMSNLGWHEFGRLILIEKLHWFKVFMQKLVDQLELEAEDVHMISEHLSSIQLTEEGSGGGKKTKSHAREVSGAMIQFSKIAKYPMEKNGGGGGEGGPQELNYWVKLISELWFSADYLHLEAYKLRRRVLETRDILRTCYVYADIFYKLGLPSYDEYLKGGSARGTPGQGVIAKRDARGEPSKKHSLRPGQQATILGAWKKFVTSSDSRKLSDISEMLVMSDFSTSIYQKILQSRPVEAEDMLMKLDSHNLDERLGSGLVSGMSVKSKK